MAVLSINQLAEFSKATEKGKARIVKQQIVPNPVLITWYQLAKGRLKKSISENWNLDPIYSGIETLKRRTQFENDRQKIDQKVSIEALECFLGIPVPRILQSIRYEKFKPDTKSLVIGSLEIVIAPDVVFRTEIDGQKYLGGFKIHVCKSKPFDLKQSSLVATLLWEYLEREVARDDEAVLPSLCFCYDVFASRIVPATEDSAVLLENVDLWSQEVNQIWNTLRQAG